MSRERITESRPKCDRCGRLGSYGQMMPWPHSGWVTANYDGESLDFHSLWCAAWWFKERAEANPALAEKDWP